MRDRILDIIKEHPKHYTTVIRKNAELVKWINKNTLSNSTYYPEVIYSAITAESNVCKHNNVKHVRRFTEGWVACGPASTCKCTQEAISVGVRLTKQKVTVDQQATINQKRKETTLHKYGVEYNTQRPEVKEKLSAPKISEEAFNKLSDLQWLTDEYITKQRSLVDIANELKVYYSTVGEYCKKYNFVIRQRSSYSLTEKEICKFLDSLSITYITHDWSILETKEIDIFIPEFNIGIEVNGLYWHSYSPKCNNCPTTENKRRHIEKTELALKKGVTLIHITDFEVNTKRHLVESLLLTRLGKSTKLYARQCVVKEVSNTDSKKFLSINHMQGYIHATTSLGLYHRDTLVMIMTFGRSRYNSATTIELLRLCSLANTVIVGGSEKLFKYAQKYFKDESIVSYCDLSKFTGTIYKKLGFEPVGVSKPGYYWTDGNYVISRFKCQKANLRKWLTTYNDKLSEADNMFAAGYRRYWDCGQQTWIFNPRKSPN